MKIVIEKHLGMIGEFYIYRSGTLCELVELFLIEKFKDTISLIDYTEEDRFRLEQRYGKNKINFASQKA